MRYFRLVPFPMVAMFVWFSSATGSYPSIIPVLAIVFSIPAAVAVAVSYIPLPSSWGQTKKAESTRSQILTWCAICLSIIIIVSTCTTHWPFRLTYQLSKRSLNALAQEVRTGNTINMPHDAGVFTIELAEKRDDLVFLYLDRDKGEPLVFIQGPPDKIVSGPGCIMLDTNFYFYNSL